MSNLRIELDQRLAAFGVAPSKTKAELLRNVLESYKGDVITLTENIDDLVAYLENYETEDDKDDANEARDNALALVPDVISCMDELS